MVIRIGSPIGIVIVYGVLTLLACSAAEPPAEVAQKVDAFDLLRLHDAGSFGGIRFGIRINLIHGLEETSRPLFSDTHRPATTWYRRPSDPATISGYAVKIFYGFSNDKLSDVVVLREFFSDVEQNRALYSALEDAYGERSWIGTLKDRSWKLPHVAITVDAYCNPEEMIALSIRIFPRSQSS